VRTDDGTHYQSNGARLITSAVVAALEKRSDWPVESEGQPLPQFGRLPWL